LQADVKRVLQRKDKVELTSINKSTKSVAQKLKIAGRVEVMKEKEASIKKKGHIVNLNRTKDSFDIKALIKNFEPRQLRPIDDKH